MINREGNYQPFSNGSEGEYWREHNCYRCSRWFEYDGESTCDMLNHVIAGEIPLDLAKRVGWIDENGKETIEERTGEIDGKTTTHLHLADCKEFATEEQLEQERIKEYSKHQHELFGGGKR